MTFFVIGHSLYLPELTKMLYPPCGYWLLELLWNAGVNGQPSWLGVCWAGTSKGHYKVKARWIDDIQKDVSVVLK